MTGGRLVPRFTRGVMMLYPCWTERNTTGLLLCAERPDCSARTKRLKMLR